MNNSWRYVIGVGLSKLYDIAFKVTHWGNKTTDLNRYPRLTVQDIEFVTMYSTGDIHFRDNWKTRWDRI